MNSHSGIWLVLVLFLILVIGGLIFIANWVPQFLGRNRFGKFAAGIITIILLALIFYWIRRVFTY